jgi:hypothetical protein
MFSQSSNRLPGDVPDLRRNIVVGTAPRADRLSPASRDQVRGYLSHVEFIEQDSTVTGDLV